MDAAVLLFALVAAAGLILALFRRSGGTRSSDAFLRVEPARVETRTQSRTFSLADLPPELQAQGNELAQLALKGQQGGAGMTHEDEERMLVLVRELAAQAPESTSAARTLGDDATKVFHVETRTSADFGSSWTEKS